MPLLPILLILPLLLLDGLVLPGSGGPGPAGSSSDPGFAAPMAALGLPLALVLLAWAGVRMMLVRLERTRRPVWLMRADRLLGIVRLLIVIGGGVITALGGWLAWVRSHVGDLVLVDELLTLAPPIAGLAGAWAVQHALEVRLRDAVRLRRLDEGRPIWPTPRRGEYVLGQVRLQLGLMGVPILAVLGLSEAVRVLAALAGDGIPGWAAEGASVATAAMVFVMAPLAMRMVLPIAPMPAGTVREDLVAMCRDLGVRVSDIMLWRTHGTLVNAAVIGVLPRVRYVLMTDAMVEQVPRTALRAVIAHELAHVRHRHVPWLVATVAGLLTVGGALAAVPAVALVERGHAPDGAVVGWTAVGVGLVALVAAGVAFGWVSRRFERQADTFAVQSMSRMPAWASLSGEGGATTTTTTTTTTTMTTPTTATTAGGVRPPAVAIAEPAARSAGGGEADVLVRPEAVLAMTAALGATARLNGVDPERPSWRHGSIGWRQRYLADLVGHPVERLAIDRQMRRLKLAAAGMLVAGIAATAAIEAWETSVHEARRDAGWWQSPGAGAHTGGRERGRGGRWAFPAPASGSAPDTDADRAGRSRGGDA